jgi:putative membrane protein
VAQRLLYAWLCNVAAIAAAAALVEGVDYADDYWVLIVAALVFAVVNLLLKPLLKLLAWPLILLTLGLALFPLNILMLYVTSWIVPGFSIETLQAGIWATVVVWAVNWALHALLALAGQRPRSP